jgi:hypothetical protein
MQKKFISRMTSAIVIQTNIKSLANVTLANDTQHIYSLQCKQIRTDLEMVYTHIFLHQTNLALRKTLNYSHNLTKGDT